MAEADSDVPLSTKGLPWLKRLQGSLEDDDSSDSSTNPSPKKVGKRQKKAEEKEARGRKKETRLRWHHADGSDDASFEQSDEKRGRKKRRIEKAVNVLGKRSTEEGHRDLKRSKSQAASAKVKAAALREQQIQKLRALRVSTDKVDQMVVSSSKRQQMTRTSEDKKKDCMRVVQVGRRVSAGAEADAENETDDQQRPLFRSKDDEDHGESILATKSRTPVQNELKQTVTSALALKNDSDLVKSDGDVDMKVNGRPIAICSASGQGHHDDDRMKELTTSTPVISPRCDSTLDSSSATVTVTVAGHAESVNTKFLAISEESSARVATGPKAKVDYGAIKCDKRESMPLEKIEGANAAKAEKTDRAAFGVENQVNTAPLVETEVAVDVVHFPVKQENQIGSPVCDATSMASDKEKKPVDEVLLHDVMPIPRKLPKDGDSGVSFSTISFVIPKRRLDQTDTAGKTSAFLEQGDTAAVPTNGYGKRSTKACVAVTYLQSASPKSSLNVTKKESPRLQRRRAKNPVPASRAPFSQQDRALMRLSRKRNSIFMASAELSAPGSNRMSSKALVSRMMGYEVYDEDGTTLPDLIPRTCCATKREMASNQEMYTSSFFGVSRMVPKAKSSNEIAQCVSREINCYEELSFKRLEDREFYQRKLYGTAFIPQILRGWITLIVRNARFERKSTGIRFNQDRDRESFAAALSQRYTLDKSVPRCDIPRDNWQKLMKNELGTVFLHYYNREVAERASRVFCDDLGQPLQIRRELKAGARIQVSSSPSTESQYQRTPRRSNSIDRCTPNPSPLYSQSGNARSFSSRRHDFDSSARSDHQSLRRDRCQLSVPSSRDESRYRSSWTDTNRSRAFLERRSRSRTRNRSCYRQNDKNGTSEVSTHHLLATDDRANSDGSNYYTANTAYSDVDVSAERRPRILPYRSLYIDQDRSKCEDGEVRRVENETLCGVKSHVKAEPRNHVGGFDEGDSNCGTPRSKSSSRRCEMVQHKARSRERRAHYSDNARHPYSGQQQHGGDFGDAPSRSRSRPRTNLPMYEGYSGNRDDRYTGKSRQSFRRADSNTYLRERRSYEDFN